MPRPRKKLKEEWKDFKKELRKDLFGEPSPNMVMAAKEMLKIFEMGKTYSTKEEAREAFKERREKFKEMMSNQRLDSGEQNQLTKLAAKWVKVQVHLLEKEKHSPDKAAELTFVHEQRSRLKEYIHDNNDSVRQFQLKGRNLAATFTKPGKFTFGGSDKKAKRLNEIFLKEVTRLNGLKNDGSLAYQLAKNNPKIKDATQQAKLDAKIKKVFDKVNHPTKDKKENDLHRIKDKLNNDYGVLLTREQQEKIWDNIQTASLQNIDNIIAKLDKLLPANNGKNESKISLAIQQTSNDTNQYRRKENFKDLQTLMKNLSKLDRANLVKILGEPAKDVKLKRKELEKAFHALEKQMAPILKAEEKNKGPRRSAATSKETPKPVDLSRFAIRAEPKTPKPAVDPASSPTPDPAPAATMTAEPPKAAPLVPEPAKVDAAPTVSPTPDPAPVAAVTAEPPKPAPKATEPPKVDVAPTVSPTPDPAPVDAVTAEPPKPAPKATEPPKVDVAGTVSPTPDPTAKKERPTPPPKPAPKTAEPPKVDVAGTVSPTPEPTAKKVPPTPPPKPAPKATEPPKVVAGTVSPTPTPDPAPAAVKPESPTPPPDAPTASPIPAEDAAYNDQLTKLKQVYDDIIGLINKIGESDKVASARLRDYIDKELSNLGELRNSKIPAEDKLKSVTEAVASFDITYKKIEEFYENKIKPNLPEPASVVEDSTPKPST